MQANRQASTAQPGATPEASGLKVALSQASMATPAKPTMRPRMREALGLSLSHSQAISAPNIGTVALRMADSPVVMDSSANEKQANGMPELRMPMKKIFFQFFFKSGSKPRSHTMGNRKSAAIPTRTAAVGSGPNSTVLMRMKRKDEPQIAASMMKSAAQLLGDAAAAGVASPVVVELKTVSPSSVRPQA